jgi:hypothetical protein
LLERHPANQHGDLKVNEDHRPVAERIYKLFVYQKMGCTRIARTLTAEGAVCPTPRPKDAPSHGWTQHTVRRVLTANCSKAR